ncbi:hypothetical protein VR43_00495 [Streptomyces sp. NRRL S-104]|nr:hypothetical protein VR43_00495 [Streptomyces sp. NRRL S-104]
MGPWIWYDLTTNEEGDYPTGACGVSIGHQANRLVIEVITVGGEIWETFCDVNPGTPDQLECDGVWNDAVPQPNPGDPPPLRTHAQPIRPMDPNHLPKALK